MGYPNNPLASGSNPSAPAPAAFAPRPVGISGPPAVAPAAQLGAGPGAPPPVPPPAVNNAQAAQSQAGAAAAFGLGEGATPDVPQEPMSLRNSIMNAMNLGGPDVPTGGPGAVAPDAGPARPTGLMPMNPGAVPTAGPGAPAGVPPVKAPPNLQPPAPFGNPVPVRPGRMANAVRGYAGRR